MLSINKSFVRKITLGAKAYLVEQDKNKKTITIQDKRTKEYLYQYNANTGDVIYAIMFENLIKLIMHYAHIDRYVLHD